MIRNYLKIGLRRLLRARLFSLINISGLTVGLTSFFFITQYVNFELSFDEFHANKENVYRVALQRTVQGDPLASADNFAGLRKLVRDNFPEVDAVTGFYKTPANTGVLFKYNGRIFNEAGGELNADSSFFKVFPDLLIRGDAATALDDPHNVVLSESLAKKIFGDADPMGRRIQKPGNDSDDRECVVTGILKDIPVNSHFHANFVVPLEYHWIQQEWSQDFLLTYISLSGQSDPNTVSRRLNLLYKNLGNKFPALKSSRCLLQPLTSIHLSSHLTNEIEANGSLPFLYAAILIGLIILVIAWINYINLETARYMARAREVGVRRIIGSRKADLAVQFLIEYFYISLAASLMSILVVLLLTPEFTRLTGIPPQNIQWPGTEIWLASLGIGLAGSFLVGIYPAIFLLRLQPLSALKGNFGTPTRSGLLRKSLIVVQFCSSLVLIALVLVIGRQLDFMRLANKNFDVDQVISIRNPTAYSAEEVVDKHKAYTLLGNTLIEHASVKMVTSSSAIPGTEIGFTYVNLLKRNINDPYDPTPFKTLFVDYNYIPFFELKLLAGRNFDPPHPLDNWKNPWEDEHWLTLILNESAIYALGFSSPEEAVDKIVEFHNFEDHFQKHRIIGVVEDYHHEAVKKEVFPMILSPNYGSFQQVYYSVRLHAGTNPRQALTFIENSWKDVFPEKPFEYFYLDQYYDQQFKSEIYFHRIFSLFAGIAMFIAGLGIFGMTVFEANARLKEISIRKILGASVGSVLALLSRDQIRIVGLAVMVSAPLIWLLADEWLSQYPLRIEISPVFFLLPLLVIAGMVALITSFQTLKAARVNPVDHLRNE